MTAIWVQPDAEYLEKEQPLIFEVPGELHRKVTNPEIAEEERRQTYLRIFGDFAIPCMKVARDHPKLAGFEIIDAAPLAMYPNEIQEDPGDIIERTIKGVPKSAVNRSRQRDTMFWAVVVKARQRKRLFNRFREVKGPKDGFESNDKLPEWMAHKKTVYDNMKDM